MSTTRGHDSTMNLSGVVIESVGQASSRLIVSCDRCQSRIHSEHYHCLQCNDSNYDICLRCASNGIYCQSDAHEWIQRRVGSDGILAIIGRLLAPNMVRTLHSTTTTTYPTLFQPPHESDTPQELFEDEHRYIRKSDPREILIYTDGACLRNGQRNPQAGCGFVYRSSAYSLDGILTHSGTVKFRLENRGPRGDPYTQTSNRAELRAVIGALQFRDWSTDCNGGWRSVVIATDSEYVAINATDRVKRWETSDWRIYDRSSQAQGQVKNQDLWKLLLGEIRELQSSGVNVSFWRIPREWNEKADKAAGLAAENVREVPNYRLILPDGPVSLHSEPWTSPQS